MAEKYCFFMCVQTDERKRKTAGEDRTNRRTLSVSTAAAGIRAHTLRCIYAPVISITATSIRSTLRDWLQPRQLHMMIIWPD